MSAKNRQKLEKDILSCSKCGFCQANCPTYREILDESACARGRIRLLRAVLEDEQKLSGSYVAKLDRCTTCMACSTACPGGIQPHRLIMAARAYTVKTKGLSTIKVLALRNVLSDEVAHSLAFALASYAQRLGLTHLAPGRLVPSGIDLHHFPLVTKSLRSQVPETNPSRVGRARVALFVGCMIDHSVPSIGHATIRVLNRLGIEVLVPKELKCCGLPLTVNGDLESAQALAEHNLGVLRELPVDQIVTACASCGNALKNEYREMLKDTSLAEVAETVAEKAIDICAYLANIIDDHTKLGEVALSATYHDPCHLVRGQGVSAEPRQLLESIPGVDFVEMPEADRCCGAGGTFQIFFPEVAWGITQRKLRNVQATCAEVVVTACPACVQRLQGGLRKMNMPQSTMHIIELLDRALMAGDQPSGKTEPHQENPARA